MEGVNVWRGADNDERGYRLILIMESVQVKRTISPPAHVHPFSAPSPSRHPSSSQLRSGSPRRLFTPAVWTCEAPRFQFRAISFTPSHPSLPIIIPLPAGRSLISISSRRVENIARVSSRTRDCQALSFVLHFARSGGEGWKGTCKCTRKCFAVASRIVRVTTITRNTSRNRYLYIIIDFTAV